MYTTGRIAPPVVRPSSGPVPPIFWTGHGWASNDFHGLKLFLRPEQPPRGQRNHLLSSSLQNMSKCLDVSVLLFSDIFDSILINQLFIYVFIFHYFSHRFTMGNYGKQLRSSYFVLRLPPNFQDSTFIIFIHISRIWWFTRNAWFQPFIYS